MASERHHFPTWRFMTRPELSAAATFIQTEQHTSHFVLIHRSDSYFTVSPLPPRLRVTARQRSGLQLAAHPISRYLSACSIQRPSSSRAGMSSPTSMSRPYSGYEDLSLSDNEPEPASQSSPAAAHTRQDSHPSSISYASEWTSPSSPSAPATDPWQSHPLASHTSHATHQPGPSGPSDPTSPPGTGRTSSLASLSASSSRPVPSSGASVSRTTTTTTATSPSDGTLVLGVAVVDFNHLVRPRPMFSCPRCADL
jgi:hypothetical protein